jgi:hypothetical protein
VLHAQAAPPLPHRDADGQADWRTSLVIHISFEVQGRTLEELEERAALALLGLASAKYEPIDFDMDVSAEQRVWQSDVPVTWRAQVTARVGAGDPGPRGAVRGSPRRRIKEPPGYPS